MSDTAERRDGGVPALSGPPEIGHAELHRTKAYPFVREGFVYGFGLSEALVKPEIPPGESAVLALRALPSGICLGIAGGARGRLFYFHPAFGVTHVGPLGNGPADGGALAAAAGGLIVGGWSGPDGGGLFRHETAPDAGQGSEQFRGTAAPIEPLPPPAEGEGVVCLAADGDCGTIYGLSRPGGLLFSLDPRSGRAEVLGRIERAAPVLAMLSDGGLIGAFAEGRLWTFAPAEGRLRALDAHAPCQMGKRYAAGVGSLIAARSGLVYGGTTTDGYLFSYDPSGGRLANLGKPNRQSNIRALVEGADGLIHGIVEEPRGMAHLFVFDPAARSFSDLGIVASSFPEPWQAHSIGAMSVGPYGEIYLGETDRISHLFIYHPPVRRGADTRA